MKIKERTLENLPPEDKKETKQDFGKFSNVIFVIFIYIYIGAYS